MLHMNASKSTENFVGFPMSSIMAFVEIYVRDTPPLTMANLVPA